MALAYKILRSSYSTAAKNSTFITSSLSIASGSSLIFDRTAAMGTSFSSLLYTVPSGRIAKVIINSLNLFCSYYVSYLFSSVRTDAMRRNQFGAVPVFNVGGYNLFDVQYSNLTYSSSGSSTWFLQGQGFTIMEPVATRSTNFFVGNNPFLSFDRYGQLNSLSSANNLNYNFRYAQSSSISTGSLTGSTSGFYSSYGNPGPYLTLAGTTAPGNSLSYTVPAPSYFLLSSGDTLNINLSIPGPIDLLVNRENSYYFSSLNSIIGQISQSIFISAGFSFDAFVIEESV